MYIKLIKENISVNYFKKIISNKYIKLTILNILSNKSYNIFDICKLNDINNILI